MPFSVNFSEYDLIIDWLIMYLLLEASILRHHVSIPIHTHWIDKALSYRVYYAFTIRFAHIHIH